MDSSIVSEDSTLLGSGKKYDNGKAPVWQGLIQYFPNALREVANVSKYGATKYNLRYDDVNWIRVNGGRERYKDALARHIIGEMVDGSIDPESQLLHAAMAAWNALAVLELTLKEIKDGKG